MEFDLPYCQSLYNEIHITIGFFVLIRCYLKIWYVTNFKQRNYLLTTVTPHVAYATDQDYFNYCVPGSPFQLFSSAIHSFDACSQFSELCVVWSASLSFALRIPC